MPSILIKQSKKIALFISVLLLLYAIVADAQTDWTLQKNENNIRVYTRDIPGSDFKEIKTNTSFDHSLSELVGLLTDMSSHTKWIYNCKQSKLIKRINESELYYYMETSVPWPVSNRDGVVCFKFSQDRETKVVTVASHAVENILPAIDGVVRVTKLKASWIFTPNANGGVDAEYQINVDPGGNVPAWIVNMFAVTGPYESLTKMKELLSKNGYKDARFDFITD